MELSILDLIKQNNSCFSINYEQSWSFGNMSEIIFYNELIA